MKPAAPVVLVVGALPPPVHGVTLVNQYILSSDLVDRFRVIHVDISDRRDLTNIGRLEIRNVLLAFQHAGRFFWALFRERPRLVYVPIARNRVGLLRDILFLLPSRLLRRRYVAHLNADAAEFRAFVEREPWWFRKLVDLAFGSDMKMIVVAESFRTAVRGFVDEKHAFVVQNGVPDLGPGPPGDLREPLVLHLSMLCREKGVFEVLEAARLLHKRGQLARFVLAGQWYREEDRREAGRFLAANDLGETVEVRGPVSDAEKVDLLRRSAVLVTPSHTEGHPLVVLEALSTATPVITTAVGGLPETVEDDHEGYLVPLGDVETLSDRIGQVVSDPSLRRRLSANARSRYERSFTLDHFAERLGDVWARLLSNGMRS